MSTSSVCPDCGTGLVASDRFCSGCGNGVVRCTNCGGVGMAGDKFCGHCGGDLPTGDTPVPGIRVTAARPGVSAWEGIQQKLKAATVDEYDVIRELGRGGMAAVFLAREIALNRNVAIKVMSPGVMMSDGMMDRFHQEAVTVANLNHSNIVTVHAVREVDDLHFFVMEFIAGRPLDKVLAKNGALPIPVVRAIVSQVGSALAYAHRRGVIHRDVKPGNILLDADGQAIVTDFGIAKVITATTTTQTGAVHGTAAYMSPEQCYASALTSASDQYSLGVVAYEMIAGRPPFSGESAFALMQAHTTIEAPPLAPVRPDCPPDLEAAVLRMLAKKPDDRWPNMNAALSGLRAFPVPPDDPVLDELVRLADSDAATPNVGDAIRTPLSPIPIVQRRTPSRASTSARSTPVSPAIPAAAVTPRPIPVTEEPVTVAAVKIAPTNTSPIVGERLQLAATVTDKAGRRLDRPVSWSTTRHDVASISTNGELTLHAAGQVGVVAAYDLQRDEVAFTVRPQPVARLEIVNAPGSITAGATCELVALPRDERGAALEGRSTAWSSSDRSVATVSERGVVTAHEAGTVTLTAKCEGKQTTVRLTIAAPPLASVAIAAPVTELAVKQRVRLTAVGTDASGDKVEIKPRWRSSDSGVATITDKGDLTGVSAGTVTITARADGIEGAVTLHVAAPVLVPPVAVISNRVVTAEAAVATGSSPLGTTRFPTKPVIAAVVGALLLGSILYVVFGTPDQPAAPTGGSNPRTLDARSVTLSDPPEVVRVGDTFPLTASVRGGDSLPPSQTQWESLTPTTRVNASTGDVAALAAGQAVIVATNGSAKDTAAFDIIAVETTGPDPITIASLEVRLPPGGDVLQIGDRTTPRVLAYDSAHVQTRGGPVTWSSSDPRIAAVDVRTGEVTAISAGSARITARGDSRRADATVVVQPPVVRDVVISGPDQLQAGESGQLTATARDARSHLIADASVTWTSANRTVVQVDATTGRLRAGDAGQAVITASAGTVTATKVVVVTKKPEVIVKAESTKREPTAEELMRAGEAGIKNAVEAYARELGARNLARVRSLYSPITDQDRKNLDALGTLMESRGLTLRRANVGAPRLESRRVLVDLSTTLKWKAFAGAATERDVAFLAVFELAGNEWRLVTCRIVGNPRLG